MWALCSSWGKRADKTQQPRKKAIDFPQFRLKSVLFPAFFTSPRSEPGTLREKGGGPTNGGST